MNSNHAHVTPDRIAFSKHVSLLAINTGSEITLIAAPYVINL